MGEEVGASGGDGEEDLAATLASMSRADRQGFKSFLD